MSTILFDCYHDRSEVQQVVQKLVDEGLKHVQIGIIVPEVAEQLATRTADDRVSGNERRQAHMHRIANIIAVDRRYDSIEQRSATAAAHAVSLADPLVHALTHAGLSVDDALLGAAQARQGATLVLICPQEE